MRKIFVSRTDGVAEVVEKIIAESESEIVLVIPKNTVLEESVSNFHLIKREASAAGKNVLIESVDEGILALAKASRIEAVHPLLKKKKRASSLSDILPADSGGGEFEIEAEDEIKPPKSSLRIPRDREPQEISAPQRPVLKKPSRRVLVWLSAFAIVLLGAFLLLSRFSKAEVIISFKKIPWQYQGEFLGKINVSAPTVNSQGNVLPAEILTEKKNLSQPFPASGRENVKEKAAGRLIIYNSYSSASQTLVTETRFVTPDGKIYRLVKTLGIPGAEVKEGKIIPSTIETDVVADKAGPEYNSGPIEKLSIPGFRGSPKYDGFYGSLIKATGGFVGEKAVPTEKDITSAKQRITEILKTSLKSDLVSNRPKDIKILEESSEIKITKLTVNERTDDKGNFTVFGEAEFKAIGFKELDLKSTLLNFAKKDNPGTVFKELDLVYRGVKADLNKGELRFSLTLSGILTQDFSPDNFKMEIQGRKIRDVKSMVLVLPGLSGAKVSVWPSWVKKLPKNPGKIKITVN